MKAAPRPLYQKGRRRPTLVDFGCRPSAPSLATFVFGPGFFGLTGVTSSLGVARIRPNRPAGGVDLLDGVLEVCVLARQNPPTSPGKREASASWTTAAWLRGFFTKVAGEKYELVIIPCGRKAIH